MSLQGNLNPEPLNPKNPKNPKTLNTLKTLKALKTLNDDSGKRSSPKDLAAQTFTENPAWAATVDIEKMEALGFRVLGLGFLGVRV